MLDVRVKALPTGAVIYLGGELNGKTCSQLLRSVVDILETQPPLLVIVLDDLEYIDSRGLGTMVSIHHRALEQQCKFTLVTADPQMERVITITGLNRLMDLQPTEEQALAH